MSKVEEVENKLERKLPLQIREFFLQYSKNCEFSVYIPDDFELPKELKSIFSAGFLILLEEFAYIECSKWRYNSI